VLIESLGLTFDCVTENVSESPFATVNVWVVSEQFAELLLLGIAAEQDMLVLVPLCCTVTVTVFAAAPEIRPPPTNRLLTVQALGANATVAVEFGFSLTKLPLSGFSMSGVAPLLADA
jgi:hypothetical protein